MKYPLKILGERLETETVLIRELRKEADTANSALASAEARMKELQDAIYELNRPVNDLFKETVLTGPRLPNPPRSFDAAQMVWSES